MPESTWAEAAMAQVRSRQLSFDFESPSESQGVLGPSLASGTPVADMKPPAGVKAPLAQVPLALSTYTSRAHQFGAEKYAVGNYLRESPDGALTMAMGYSSALMRHVGAFNDSIIRHLGGGLGHEPDATDAAYAADPESGLPHLAHAAASLGMLIQKLVDLGYLPADPGITWITKEKP